MTDRIVVKEGEIHKVRNSINVGLLYQLARYCYENDLRFGQVLWTITAYWDNLYFMENDELERRIKEFIKQ